MPIWRPWKNLLAATATAMLALSCSAPLWPGERPRVLPILQRWSGDFPLAQIDRLPEGQRQLPKGFFGDAESFAAAWQGLKPDTAVPPVDFNNHLVVFSRNLNHYSRTLITKVILTAGVVEIVAKETAAASPVEEKVAMALALIPRAGLEFIQAGKERIPVR